MTQALSPALIYLIQYNSNPTNTYAFSAIKTFKYTGFVYFVVIKLVWIVANGFWNPFVWVSIESEKDQEPTWFNFNRSMDKWFYVL